MKKFLCLLLLLPLFTLAQPAGSKKPLDHSVYDGWQSVGERAISPDGNWVVFTVNPQEGDGDLVISSVDGKKRKSVPRGYNPTITEDSRYLICRIKPRFADTRQARIKKKRPDDMPKDSLVLIQLSDLSQQLTVPRIKSYKTPEKAGGWMAWHLEKPAPDTARKKAGPDPEKKRIDSLMNITLRELKAADSIINNTLDSARKRTGNLEEVKKITAEMYRQLEDLKKKMKKEGRDEDEADALLAEGDEPGAATDGTDLVLRNTGSKQDKTFKLVSEYYFSNTGRKLLLKTTKNSKDSLSKALILLHDLASGRTDTVMKGGNDMKSFAMDEEGSQLAFVAERDSSSKALQKFYKLWYYKQGSDSARLLADRSTPGMPANWTVSENANISFSKSGRQLYLGTAPVMAPKDTTVPEIDQVKLDIWNYRDDYLQTVQLRRLDNELKRSFLARWDWEAGRLVQLADQQVPDVAPTMEGDGPIFLGSTDMGKRIESQWTGSTRRDIYLISPNGNRQLIRKDHDGFASASYTGKYVIWYDNKTRHYYVYENGTTRNITAAIKTPLYDEENDVPDDPSPYGLMGWQENDEFVYVYDRFDIWKVDPRGQQPPQILNLLFGRKDEVASRYIRLDNRERFIKKDQLMAFRSFSEKTKESYFLLRQEKNGSPELSGFGNGPYTYSGLQKAKQAAAVIFLKENYEESPNIHAQVLGEKEVDPAFMRSLGEVRLSDINPQQKQYNWGRAELFKWKAFDGKMSAGILYKPENFDSAKKYPMIVYFYERHSDDLLQYQAPAPTPSRLNISFFVSRGYLVFAPDITYTKGYPGKGAYDYIVSGTQALSKFRWVDARNIGIQGQSWGGYQVAHLITRTNIYKAAWAGAPVANMTSAYGGIRWESGLNRQFQYERSQSRIGATLWEKPELYIENSPLFHLPKVNTPLVIMANDNDGAVPWYQGIELFTALRRLGKPVWMLNYNGEAHNLVERRNRKDIQIREQQFFDWLLKGEKPGRWLTEGVPAVLKGRTLGLEQ